MKYGLLVGRFQPFHLGHLRAVKFALKKVEMLWIVVGSAQKSHEPKNPFTAGERIMMTKSALDANKVNPRRWIAVPVNDVDIHSLWVDQVNMMVARYDVVFTNDQFSTMLFREHGKRVMKVPLLNRRHLSGTEVRRRMAGGEEWERLVPKQVAQIIAQIKGVDRVRMLQAN
jgi:nicotinamide-nucleotide adenylyltransferase